MARVQEFLTCRRILCMMVILCFMLHFMLRINMSIAIVNMATKNISNINLQTHTLHFDWNEDMKNDILGCFFWGYLLTGIPGGRLSEIYGPRIVLGLAMLLASVLTILTPLACYLHYYWVIVVRTGIGLALGLTFPALPPMAIRWVDSTDTSKFMSHMIAGNLGASLTLVLCGYLIVSLGWPSVFYVTGTMGLLFSVAWFYLVYDSPRQHPRISKEEREELRRSEINSFEEKKIPWKKILTSAPVWATVIAYGCLLFNVNLVISQLPSYMDQVLHFNIRQNGLLSSLSFLANYGMALGSSHVADDWRKMKKYSTIAIRKFFSTITFLVPSVLFTIQSFWGYNRTVSVIVLTLCHGFSGCGIAGFTANGLDLSPVYSGTILGIASAFGALTGYISTKIVALITREKQDFEQWRYIFWILVGVNLIGCIFYLIFASAELQNWNPKVEETEMHKLQRDKTEQCVEENQPL